MKINKRTSHFLDLSRAASAFLVLIGHIHMVLFVDIEKSKLFSVGSFFNFISSYAHQADIVFFVLSGFLVGRSAINSISENSEKKLKHYFLDRITRIYVVLIPVLFFTLAVDMVSLGFDSTASGAIEARSTLPVFIGNLFLLQDIFSPRFGSNGPLWSLAYEFWYYALFPICLLIFRKPYFVRSKLFYLSLFFLLIVVLPMGVLRGFLFWLAGVSILWFDSAICKNTSLVGALFLTVLITSGVDLVSFKFSGFAFDLAISVSFALLINSLLYSSIEPEGRSLEVCRWFSAFSFSLYVTHFPLLIALGAVFGKSDIDSLRGGAVVLIALSLCYSIAWFFYLLTERNTNFVRLFLYKKIFR